MKILASVYACSPYDGSERAVGWNWLSELDKYHEITALTSHVYRADIEDYKSKNPGVLQNTKFVYLDVPNTFWHVGYRFERIYYILWQKEAYIQAKKLVHKEHFDLVHHITYVTCVLPTYMHKLGIPFLYGPVSGGENIPLIIGYPMSKKNKLVELVRTAVQIFFQSTPNFKKTLERSSLILTVTEETKMMIPQKYWYKVKVFQSIGLNEDVFYPEPALKPNRPPKFLMAGRMIYWKGYELGIIAFVDALDKGCKASLTILGDTENNPAQESYCENLKKLCGKHLNKEIKFVSKVEHSKMKGFYDKFDALINCSLRDSGNFVVMEAMSRGLPVICVNTGGPKVNTTKEVAIKIEPAPMQNMINQISNAICEIAESRDKRVNMGIAAKEYAKNTFLLDARTKQIGKFYEQIVQK